MADWSTIASLATAGGTLVLAVSTFSAVRSSNRSARVAERALLAGLRPVLVPSRLEDPTEKVSFVDRWVSVRGGMAEVFYEDGIVYMTMALRNVGSGLAVLHGWRAVGERIVGISEPVDPESFRRLNRDIYVPAGSTGFWQGAVRDGNDPLQSELCAAIEAGDGITIDLLYGDHEGGQRTISRFGLTPREGSEHLTSVTRHWSLDGPGAR
ncbi:MAG: hypothetical protein ACRDK2_14310 [Solirubrobacteraceae bacterium]